MMNEVMDQATVAVDVEMHAFMGGAVRMVEIPVDEWLGASEEERLEMVFRYGQNEVQPKPFCSVSVGDVIVIGRDRFRVAALGFERV